MLTVLSSSMSFLQPLAISTVCMKFLAWPRLKKLRDCDFLPISMMRLDWLYFALERARRGMSTDGSFFFDADVTTDSASPTIFVDVALLRADLPERFLVLVLAIRG